MRSDARILNLRKNIEFTKAARPDMTKAIQLIISSRRGGGMILVYVID